MGFDWLIDYLLSPFKDLIANLTRIISQAFRTLELSMNVKVGFVGLGLMGAPMAENLLSAGFDVHVISRSRGPIDRLVTKGAVHATSYRELAEGAKFIVTMLPTPKSTREVLFEPDGLIAQLDPETILIDMATEDPSLSLEIYNIAKGNQIAALDAPVSGGDVGAIAGKLSIMVGGDREAFDRAQGLFAPMGTPRYLGGAGSGSKVKAANQVIVAGTLAALSEALLLLDDSVSTVDALAALGGGRAGSALLEAKGASMIEGRFEPGFKVDLHLKDLKIALDYAKEKGVSAPVTALATQLLTAVSLSGGGDLDHSAIIQAIRGLAKLQLNLG